MSLRDRITDANTKKVIQCLTCQYLQALPKDDADELRQALANPNVTGTAIAFALTAEGYEIGASSVQRHRKSGHDSQ